MNKLGRPPTVSITCECGEPKVDGKCPLCHPLKKPGRRLQKVQAIVVKRVRESERKQGSLPSKREMEDGFLKAYAKRGRR